MERHPVAWLVVFSALFLLALVGILISVGRLRFEKRVGRETRALMRTPRSNLPEVPVELPEPVARYRRLAVGERLPVHTLRLEHHGTFRTSPTAKESPIHGMQFFTADPPGFLWTGHIRTMPGVWLDVRDMLVAGKGSMRVLLEDVVPVVDEAGVHIDQGSALRLLAEMVWYPTSLFDSRSVTWSAIDEHHARATLLAGDHRVSGIFSFGDDGMPVSMAAERYGDDGTLHPWGGTYRDWRTVSGLRVPFEAQVTWQLASGPFTYAHWKIDSMQFDQLS
jgi:hypothetical protein